MKKGNAYNFKLPSIEILKRLYFNEGLSSLKIAKKFGVTKAAVRLKMTRAGIKLRTKSDSQKLNSNFIKLNKRLVEFINGLLLGDGSLVMARHRKSARYLHSDKNKEYIYWLKKELEKFGLEVKIRTEIRDIGKNEIKDLKRYYHLSTKSYRDFMSLRRRWYPNGKKKTPDIKITPITLFNWYIGDGHYNPPFKEGKLRGEQVTIAMLYDYAGRTVLVEKLNKLGIYCTEHKTCIYVRSKSKQSFFDYIGQHKYLVPECYKYKFPEGYYAT
ncbi:MAG: hypothetical protein M0R32_06020 [Candidatus Cloacimonetes bacterium]|jgi:hypothetical protein|nr:hypothetical protein [Candidatus Cloacimonadota bacterium]